MNEIESSFGALKTTQRKRERNFCLFYIIINLISLAKKQKQIK